MTGAAVRDSRTAGVRSDDRSIPIFTQVPPYALVQAVADDHAAPLIRKGEVAVVEDALWTIPEDGGIYLIEWESPLTLPSHSIVEGLHPSSTRTRAIVEVIRQEKTGLWWARPFVISTNRRRDIFVSSDGPYADQYTLAYKILGPMIGLYRPNPIS